MSWRPDRYRALRERVWGRRVEDDVAEELEQHIAMFVSELVSRGVPAAEAERLARERFGDMERYRVETLRIERARESEKRRVELTDLILRNVRRALRTLWKAPGFSAVTITTLALAIALSTAMFTLLYSIVLRPLPYPAADRLVWLESILPKANAEWRWGLSEAGYFQFKDNSRSIEEIGAFSARETTLSGDGGAERVDAVRTTASLFTTLGARPHVGRLFDARDEHSDTARVAVLSYELWQRRYGSDPGVVGRTIALGGRPVEVVGVTKRGFSLPDRPVDVWVPLALDRAHTPQNHHYLSAIARLRAGTTLEAVSADVARITHTFTELFPRAYPEAFMTRSGFATQALPLQQFVIGDAARTLRMLFGAVLIVLIVACANVANLCIARAETRRRDVAVRTALGAGTGSLAVEFITEALVLCSAACVLGIALAAAGLRVFARFAPDSLPRLQDVQIGAATFAAAALATIVLSAVLGLVPMLHVRTTRILEVLRESGRGVVSARQRIRRVLLVAQVALAVVLLAGALLLIQSFVRLSHVSPGFDARGVIAFDIRLPETRYGDDGRARAFLEELRTELRALPGVQSVATTSSVPLRSNAGPFRGGGACSQVNFNRVNDDGSVRQDGPCLPTIYVSPEYFRTLGVQPLRGQLPERFTDKEIVVSRAFAEHFFKDRDVLGEMLGTEGRAPHAAVTAVVADVRGDGLDRPPYEAVYAVQPFGSTLLVRASGDEDSLTRSIQRVIARLDPDVPLSRAESLEHVVASSPSVLRLTLSMALLGTAAGMALLLSAVGLYGVISYLVAQRRSEIGVRIALGASVARVVGMVMGQSATLAGIGVAIGIAAAVVLTRTLESFLFDVRARDPLTLLCATAVMFAVALAASYLPAARAARVPPVEAMRTD